MKWPFSMWRHKFLRDWHDFNTDAVEAAERLERNDAYWQKVIDEKDTQIVLLQRERDALNSQLEVVYNSMMDLAERNITLRAKLGESPVGFLEEIAVTDEPELGLGVYQDNVRR